MLQQGVIVEWWDNFNRFYALGNPTLNNGAVRSADWTVHGFRVPARTCHQDVTLSGLVDALPTDLFEDDAVDLVKSFCQQRVFCDSWMSNSYGNQLRVNRVPVKPDVEQCSEHPQVMERIRERGSSLKFFHPVAIHDIDIGSNRGLVIIVRGWIEDHVQRKTKRLRIVCLDVDIYWRVMKVNCVIA